MKLEKLTIHNIASIEDAEIDFNSGALKDEALFLLCGETGSGKTTILDAICLALYGHTPRYDGTTEKKATEVSGLRYNDELQLVRRGTGDAFAKLTLQGNDGVRYEAEWGVESYKNQVKDKSGNDKKGKLNPKSEYHRWKNLNTKLSEDGKEKIQEFIARAIGLDFTQFCRTTLLAQGQFTKFLLASEDEKAEILEKLTNTERFAQLGQMIAARAKEEKDKIGDCDKEIAKYPVMSDEERAIKDKELAEVQARESAFEEELKSIRGRLQWLDKRDGIVGLLEGDDGARKKLEKAQKAEREPAFVANKTRLAEWDESQPIHEVFREVHRLRTSLQDTESQLEKLAPTCQGKTAESLKNELDTINARITEITTLLGRFARRDDLQKDISNLDASITNAKKRIEEISVQLKKLTPRFEKAKAELKTAEGNRNAARDLLGLDVVVAQLHIGDECPICHSVVKSLPENSHFKKLLEGLKEAVDQASEQKTNLESEISRLKGKLLGFKEQLERDEPARADRNKELEGVQQDIGERTKTDLEREKCSLEQRQQEQNKLMRNVLQYEEHNKQKQRDERALETATKTLGDFLLGHSNLTEQRLVDLVKIDVSEIRKKVGAIEKAVSDAKTQVETLCGQLKENTENRPADYVESDTVKGLEEAASAKDKAKTETTELRATLEKVIDTDNTNRPLRQDAERRKVEQEWIAGEWASLQKLFGDNDGKTIRRVIQAYVLKNVLEKANEYLKKLTDHYELSAVGLTLTVKDKYNPNMESPAKTLSGGEGFIVSLSLALALASMNDTGLAVDMLFIDEGFGTLSGEYLNSVMSALERLNAISGSRKVGVISHVEELRRRIRTHIEVKREGLGPSKVRVTVNEKPSPMAMD